MPTLTLREGLGRPLTYQEMDDNLRFVEVKAQEADSSAESAELAAQVVDADRQHVDQQRQAVDDAAQQADQYARQAEAARDQAVEISDPESQVRTLFDIWVRDVERAQFEAATGGACTIERTPDGQPCYMHIIPRTQWEDLVPSGELGSGTHEAFIENGVEKSELLIGMYMAAEINGEMVSQPLTVGRRSITWDQSMAAANAVGMSLFSNWEWSLVAFWCMSNGFQPRGNTDYGKSHSHPHERGVYDGDGNGEEYTLLGSGPNTWRHNGAPNGIADLVGNRWEWVWGFKMVDGRIFLAPDNDPNLAESAWVDTGYDLPSDANPWSSLTQAGATQQVQRALIVPNGVADPDGRLYANLSGERFPLRGGGRDNGGNAGLGALHLNHVRSDSRTFFGLRLSRLV